MEENFEGIEPAGARLAFEALQPLLEVQSPAGRITTSHDKAIIFAAATGRQVKQPEIRARFASLPASEFDIAHVDRLEAAALATWHTGLALRSASVQTSTAKLPEGVVEDGAVLKERMFQVLTYHLGTRKDVSSELTDIRDGTGYIDTAKDLIRLGNLYELYAAELASDTRHYRAEDRTEAGRIGHIILQVLGDGRASDARYWSSYQRRAWGLLLATYDEVAAAGQWLFRHENGAERFPSLYTIGREPVRRRRPDDGAGSPDDGDVVAPV